MDRENEMPTGYTAKLMKDGQTFPDFVMGCARAMGACITMREDSNDKPIPQEFQPSSWDDEQRVVAEKELEHLRSLTIGEQIGFGMSRKQKEMDRWCAQIGRRAVTNARLDEMEKMVHEWTPPTKEHHGLKKFMLQQLEISHEATDYIVKSLTQAKAKSPQEYWLEAIETAKYAVEYSKKEQAKENDRVAGRNEWVRQLRESLA